MRFVSPSVLCLSLVALILPFVEVRCEGGGQKMTMLQQNGIEAMLGKVSLAPDFEKLAKGGGPGGGGPGGGDAGMDKALEKKETGPATILFGWAACVVLGIILGFILTQGGARKGLRHDHRWTEMNTDDHLWSSENRKLLLRTNPA